MACWAQHRSTIAADLLGAAHQGGKKKKGKKVGKKKGKKGGKKKGGKKKKLKKKK